MPCPGRGRFTIAWASPARRARFVLTAQRIDGKVLVRVGPRRLHGPAGAAGQRGERLDRVLVAALGVDRLAGTEFDVSPQIFTFWRRMLARCISIRERSRLKKAWCSKDLRLKLAPSS